MGLNAEPNGELLLSFAQRLAQFPSDANAYSNLVLRLQLVSKLEPCVDLLQRFGLYPHVTYLVWKRVVQIAGEEEGALLFAAHAFYAMGEDEDARAVLDGVLERNAESVAAWELMAMISPDVEMKREIFERILKIEPGNRSAVDNLIMLGRPR